MKRLWMIWIVLTLVSNVALAAPAGNIHTGYEDFYSQTGVNAPSNMATLETGQQVVTQISDVKAAHGFFNADIQKGDKVSIKKIAEDTLLVIHEKSGLKMKVTLIKE